MRFLFGETGLADLKIEMQLSGGQLPATARRSRTLIFRSIGTKNVTNLAGTSTDKRYLKCIPITVFDILLTKDIDVFIYETTTVYEKASDLQSDALILIRP